MDNGHRLDEIRTPAWQIKQRWWWQNSETQRRFTKDENLLLPPHFNSSAPNSRWQWNNPQTRPIRRPFRNAFKATQRNRMNSYCLFFLSFCWLLLKRTTWEVDLFIFSSVSRESFFFFISPSNAGPSICSLIFYYFDVDTFRFLWLLNKIRYDGESQLPHWSHTSAAYTFVLRYHTHTHIYTHKQFNIDPLSHRKQ